MIRPYYTILLLFIEGGEKTGDTDRLCAGYPSDNSAPASIF